MHIGVGLCKQWKRMLEADDNKMYIKMYNRIYGTAMEFKKSHVFLLIL